MNDSRTPNAAPEGRRRRRFGPRIGLSLMVAGLAAMLPARLDSLAPLWPRAATEAAPAPVRMRDGEAFAVPMMAATLAGTPRFNPLADERAVDGRMLAELTRRQAELERREREAELRETRAVAAENLARTQLGELARMRQQLEQLVQRESAASDADLDALVALYMNMRPEQAAKVMERLEANRAAAVLLRIPERQAGPILAQMEPDAALAVTQNIASRRGPSGADARVACALRHVAGAHTRRTFPTMRCQRLLRCARTSVTSVTPSARRARWHKTCQPQESARRLRGGGEGRRMTPCAVTSKRASG
jgi:flagellar motility protein MotE (MotC chaperone)